MTDNSEADSIGTYSDTEVADNREADKTYAKSDIEGADRSEEESGEDDTVTDIDGEEGIHGKVSCPIGTWEALAQMSMAMGQPVSHPSQLSTLICRIRVPLTLSNTISFGFVLR